MNHVIRLKALFVFLISTSALPSSATAELNKGTSGDYVADDAGTEVRDFVDLVHRQLGFSGVVLAGRDGKVIAAISRGTVSEKSTAPLTFKSLFEIASSTKPFTAIAIMQLAENGKLSLDDPHFQASAKGPQQFAGRLQSRHLLAHTSGIPGTNTIGFGNDIEKVVLSFLRGGPRHTPGTHFEYWNQGYSLLSEIIARASGRPYTQYVREAIFVPCGMTASRFTGDPAPEGAVVAVGASSRGEHRSALAHPYGSYGFQYRGMGGLGYQRGKTCGSGIGALSDNKLIKRVSLSEMTTGGIGGRGLGWSIDPGPDGQAMHGHSGSVRGFLADVRRYPSLDGAIFVLANHDESLPFTTVVTGVERILFGEPADQSFPTRPDASFIDRVVGQYTDSKKRRLTIDASGALPRIRIYWGGPVTSGYLGLDVNDQPHLYMMSKSKDGLRLKADSPLEFSPGSRKSQSVSLLNLKPKLTFRRSKR